MKKSIMTLLPLWVFLNVSSANALDIDEKLTLRFLRVSATKKTVLVNRGGEDGLVVGDHAKFFITAGVVARGAVEKVSPTRSVWSLYRIVDPSEIVEDKVLNLKIATPAKITDDPSRSLKDEPIPGGTESINVGDEVGTSRTDEGLSAAKDMAVTDADEAELRDVSGESDGSSTKKSKIKNSKKVKKASEDLDINDDDEMSNNAAEEEYKEVRRDARREAQSEAQREKDARKESHYENSLPLFRSNIRNKTWEVVGALNINSLWYETSNTSTAASLTGLDLSLFIEKYFYNNNNFFRDFSLYGLLHRSSLNAGTSVDTNQYFEYGLGLNYHFYNKGYHTNRFIGFGNFAIGAGSVSTETVSTTNSAVSTDSGSNSFFSFGTGVKYFTSNGVGVRAMIDYYHSSESRELADLTTSDVTLSGLRFQLGMSYRF